MFKTIKRMFYLLSDTRQIKTAEDAREMRENKPYTKIDQVLWHVEGAAKSDNTTFLFRPIDQKVIDELGKRGFTVQLIHDHGPKDFYQIPW